jgi:hypothetical protein
MTAYPAGLTWSTNAAYAGAPAFGDLAAGLAEASSALALDAEPRRGRANHRGLRGDECSLRRMDSSHGTSCRAKPEEAHTTNFSTIF